MKIKKTLYGWEFIPETSDEEKELKEFVLKEENFRVIQAWASDGKTTEYVGLPKLQKSVSRLNNMNPQNPSHRISTTGCNSMLVREIIHKYRAGVVRHKGLESA